MTRAYGLKAENLDHHGSLADGRGRCGVRRDATTRASTGSASAGPARWRLRAEMGLSHTLWYEGTGQQPPSTLGLNVLADTSMALELLFSDGYARMLAQPRLVCSSGSKAQFLAGGEVPVVVIDDRR